MLTARQIKCPRCGKPTVWNGNPHRPFCSEKCRFIDLARWANQEYAIDGGRAPQRERDDEFDY
ncbi:MAG: DNA gyrase inhibitor YacG [Desulfuromonadales bacterium]|nr:DNA gyrase inhibitor YacG [Chloroflexota bacterium]MCK4622433.1 DNA gyrase inhibitor YacG [Desulfuromonadales bacterium]